MRELPENKFGYLLLCNDLDGKGVYIKANKICCINYTNEDKVMISLDDDSFFVVTDTIDKILEQLENIHPSMR